MFIWFLYIDLSGILLCVYAFISPMITSTVPFSQKATIDELKTGLDEERSQRKEERETAATEIKAAIHKCQVEAQEELNRFSDVAMRHEREQQEVINKMKV